MRKIRGYRREIPAEPLRDYKVFAIACEGCKREPGYFRLFEYLSDRIKVDVIEPLDCNGDEPVDAKTKSSPTWVLDRATSYIEQEGLADEDDLWFVLDVDRWKEEQIRLIAEYCQERPNWNIVLSNPCFEVWLYLHKKRDLTDSISTECKQLKHEISLFEAGGYHPLKFIQNFPSAIENARNLDKDRAHFWADSMTTKIYQLGDAIIEVVGINDLETFLTEKIPALAVKHKFNL